MAQACRTPTTIRSRSNKLYGKAKATPTGRRRGPADLIGVGAAQERGVVGETPNLAARLQAVATPNTLVIAEATRRQLSLSVT